MAESTNGTSGAPAESSPPSPFDAELSAQSEAAVAPSNADDAPAPERSPEPELPEASEADALHGSSVAEADGTAAPTSELEPEPDTTNGADISVGGVDELAVRLVAIEEGIAGLGRSVAEAARLGRRHADHVDALHSDNQRLRSGEIALAVAPMHRDIMRLHDEVHSLEDSAHESVRGDLSLVRARVADVLGRWGIFPDVPAVGDAFDPRVHQGVGRVESEDGTDGTIAQVRRVGFVHEDGRIIRVAEVEVFTSPQRLVEPGEPAEPAESTEPGSPDDADDTTTVGSETPLPATDLSPPEPTSSRES